MASGAEKTSGTRRSSSFDPSKYTYFIPCAGSGASSGRLSFQDHTLVVPALSIGNAAQLAVDLLVSTLSLRRVGFLEDPNVLPVCGNDVFRVRNDKPGDVAIALEVFQSSSRKITVLQQRAPIKRRGTPYFLDNLLAWYKESGFSDMVLLTSSDASNRHDSQLTGKQLRYLVTKGAPPADRLKKLGWLELEPLPKEQLQEYVKHWKERDPKRKLTKAELAVAAVSRGGITRRLFAKCDEAKVPLTVVVHFCNEGDNVGDARFLCSNLNHLLKLEEPTNKVRWVKPHSWDLIYGSPVDPSLYG